MDVMISVRNCSEAYRPPECMDTQIDQIKASALLDIWSYGTLRPLHPASNDLVQTFTVLFGLCFFNPHFREYVVAALPLVTAFLFLADQMTVSV